MMFKTLGNFHALRTEMRPERCPILVKASHLQGWPRTWALLWTGDRAGRWLHQNPDVGFIVTTDVALLNKE